MPHSAFESSDALQGFLAHSTIEQFRENLPHLSLTELADCLSLLQKQPVLDADGKFESLFQFVESPTMLEMIGKHFSVDSFLKFLEFLSDHPQYHSRLTYILIGLNPSIFSQALHRLQDPLLPILKQEGLLEPLHYQLTQFVHEGEALKHSIEEKIAQCEQEFISIDPAALTQEGLQELFERIDDLRNQLLDYLERASTALAIVWHTDRVDLIEKVSAINESLQQQLTYAIGHPALDNLPATGLYAALEQILALVFGPSLKDEDASIEGMTQLAIWHLKDYWELGLLPSEKGEHQQLMGVVQQQLERLGIPKIEHLKKCHLFSKSLLKDFIMKHRDLIKE